MNHKEEILKTLSEELPKLKQMFDVKTVGLFGSIVKGEEKPGSDIDVLVEFEEGGETFKNYMGFKFFLEELFGVKVDLVVKETIKPILKETILQEAIYV